MEFDTLDMVPTGDVWPKCIFFPKIVTVMIVYDKSCRPILCVIILVIDKLNSRFAVVRFCLSLI